MCKKLGPNRVNIMILYYESTILITSVWYIRMKKTLGVRCTFKNKPPTKLCLLFSRKTISVIFISKTYLMTKTFKMWIDLRQYRGARGFIFVCEASFNVLNAVDWHFLRNENISFCWKSI